MPVLGRGRVAVDAVAVAMPDRDSGHGATLVRARGDFVRRLVEVDVTEECVEAEVVDALEHARDQERGTEGDAE